MKENIKKVLFTATVDSHILHFHIPYLKMFKDEGYEVHVATNGDAKIPYCDVKHVVSFERSPFGVNNLKAIKQLKKIIEKEKFDVIHCHTPMGSVVTRIAASHARKAYKTRVIYTAHGFHFYKGAPLLNWMLFYPVEKILSYKTDDLITINKEDYEFAKKKMRAKRIHYIPGVGVDPEKFSLKMSEDEKDKLRQEVGISKDDFVLICVGELNDNKNQIMQIEAMRELVKENNNIKLLLAGDGYKKEFLQEKIREYNLEENVKLLGYRTDIPRLFQISNAAVSTSKREGLPVNIIEAQICGLPCIVTDCRGNRDLVQDGINGFVININDVSSLRQEMLDTENIPAITIRDEFKLNNILNQYLKIYFNKNTIPKIIHYVWMGKAPKDKQIKKCMKTWKKKLPDYKFIEWNEETFDINSNEYTKNAYKEKKWAFVSDYVRAWAIYNYGGIYFDTDIIVLKNIDELLYNDAFVGFESNTKPFTAVFGAVPNHKFLKDMMQHFDTCGTDFETTNTEWVSEMLIKDYGCKLGNVEQILDSNLKVYKKEDLCVPSNYGYTVHAFKGSWVSKKSLFSRMATFIRLNSNLRICRFIYKNIILKIKDRGD